MEMKGLSAEQQMKLDACTTSDELLELVKEEGIELTDEQIDQISGGLEKDWGGLYTCPFCEERVVTWTNGNWWCSHCGAKGNDETIIKR